MFTLQDIWDALYEILNAGDTAARIAQIQRECRKAYYELCAGTSWEHLRDEFTYTYDATVGGMWVPADVIGIDAVATTEYVWKKGTRAAALCETLPERMWYIDEYNRTPLVSGADISIANGATTFTGGASITAAMVGEYIRFGGQGAVHKLLSATTIETPYYGTALVSTGTYEIRPVGVMKMKLASEGGVNDETAATVYVWRLPNQLYSGTQIVELPTAAMLELATAVKVFTADRDVDNKNSVQKDLYGSKGRYDGELDRARSLNPDFVLPTRPANFHGRNAGYGARSS